MSRSVANGWWKFAAAAALLGVVLGIFVRSGASNAEEAFDLVIVNGRVMDPESGLDGVRNVGIRSGKIAAISTGTLAGKQTIEARGLVVAPGFIDLHQHGQDAENYALKAADGVTTALELEVGVADVDRWYGEREGKARINFGASAGHIAVRMAVMHDPGELLPRGDAAHRVATTAELQEISAMLEKGLKRGAVAVGLGPAYTEAATNQEIVDVFRVAAKYHASCHVHIRGSGTPLEGNDRGGALPRHGRDHGKLSLQQGHDQHPIRVVRPPRGRAG
jgi:cytosine/adenosine deaminase-related metal-dependent hydrolase